MTGARTSSGDVLLRDVTEADLPTFYEHQLDPDACMMAAFVSRDRETFMSHWTKILRDESAIARTILQDGHVAGNVVSFEANGKPLVGYWIGKEFWGKGVATRALTEFLREVRTRPIYAHVAKHNVGSIRVLEKCGFTICGEEKGAPDASGAEVEEVVLRLGGGDGDTAS